MDQVLMKQILLKVEEVSNKVKAVEDNVTWLRNETKTFRKEMRRKHDKAESKTSERFDLISRKIGSYHEKLCRASLYRSLPQLLRSCRELELFSSVESQGDLCFTSVGQITSYLKLKPAEVLRLRDRLVQLCRGQQVGRLILNRFIAMVNQNLESSYPASTEKWPTHVEVCNKVLQEVEHLLSISAAVPLIVKKVEELKILGSQVQPIKDLADPVLAAYIQSMGPKQIVKWATEIMHESWGLLILFWAAKEMLRHPNMQVDVCGRVERKGKSWVVGLGEVKSSEGRALIKGKRQLAFQESILKWVCEVGCLDAKVSVVKALFLIYHNQEQRPTISREDGYIFVNVTQLPG